MFIGRRRELAALQAEFDAVSRGNRLDRGIAVMIRGRRRVGKSRLASEFATRTGAPYVHFQASRGAPLAQEIATLHRAIARSPLPGAALATRLTATTLTEALTNLADLLPEDTPSVVVLDEIPWLLESIPGGAGELQRAWDLELSRKPVLLILLGSDISMMERITQADQPFYGRATEMILRELNPHDVATMTQTSGVEAFDAYLVTGGQPLIAQEWEPGSTLSAFLQDSLERQTSALLVNGTRILDSEFSEGSLSRQVLTAIGGQGERTFTNIQRALEGGSTPHPQTLNSAINRLLGRRVIAADEPLSTKTAPKDRRFRVADPGLRFHLAFLEKGLADIEAGRPKGVLQQIHTSYSTWRGRAIEAVVRDSVQRLHHDEWPDVRHVGGWWPRTNNPEIDLVATDTRPAKEISFVGTIKWRDNKPLSRHDSDQLRREAASVPGFTESTALVGVCPAGGSVDLGLAAIWSADDLLAAWES